MSSRLPEDEPLSRDWIEAFRGDNADVAQVRRAYLRYLQRSRPARRPAPALQIAGWVLVGVVVGMSSVYAATGPLRRWWLSEPMAEPPALRAPTMTTPNPQPTLPRRNAVDLPVPSASAPVAPPSALLAPSSSSSAAAAREEWQRAARGLRERDFETANSALEELARRASGAERESAQLVQAQLLLAQGRDAEAVSLLRELSRSVRSPSVRQKSSELLKRVETLPSQRSFAPAEGTNDP